MQGVVQSPPSTREEEAFNKRRKLQICEWSVELRDAEYWEFNDAPLDVQAELQRLREIDAPILQKQIICGGDPLDRAKRIFVAAEEGNLQEFELLMNDEVKIWFFKLGEYGNATPLHWAALHGQREIVNSIKRRKPQNHTDEHLLYSHDKFGFTPTHLAVLSCLVVPEPAQDTQCYELIKDFREWKDIGYVSLGPSTCKLYSIEDSCVYVDHFGLRLTPLHLAVWLAPKSVVEAILKWWGATLERRTTWGQTPLHLAAWKGRNDIMEILLESMIIANLPEVVNSLDFDRQTPLHLAVLTRSKACVSTLLTRGQLIRVSERNQKGYTPMEMATVLLSSKSPTLTSQDLLRFGVMKNVDRVPFHGTGDGKLDLREIISAFDGWDPEALQRDRQVYVDAANAILVGAALIASASFGAWLAPPLGTTPYYSEGFLVTDSAAPPETYRAFVDIKQYWTIELFWVFNSLSFFLSVATVIAGADAALPRQGLILKDAVASVRQGVVWASYLLFVSLLFVIGSFSAIGFTLLPPISRYRVNMYCTLIVGLAVCIFVLVRFLRKLRSWTVFA